MLGNSHIVISTIFTSEVLEMNQEDPRFQLKLIYAAAIIYAVLVVATWGFPPTIGSLFIVVPMMLIGAWLTIRQIKREDEAVA